MVYILFMSIIKAFVIFILIRKAWHINAVAAEGAVR